MTSLPIVEYVTVFVALYATIFYFLLLFQSRRKLYSEPSLLPDSTLPSVSIVIPVLNEAGTISKTLDSVLNLNYPKSKLEIIVVDDESTDDTVNEVQSFAKYGVKLVRHVHCGVGKSSALNAGIRIATGELIATLDSDSFPSRDSLRRLASFFADNSITAVTAAVKVYSPRNWLEKLQSVEYLFVFFTRRLLSFVDSVTVTPGPMSVFRKNVFDKVGLFDETSILEDQEMAYRLQARNYKILSSLSAEVYTQVPAKFSDLLRQRVRWNRGGMRNVFKHRKLLNPRYGDLGIVILPMSLLTVILIFAIFASVIWQIISGQFFSWFSLEAFIYTLGGIQVVSAILLLIGIAWLLIGRKLFEDKQLVSLPRLFAFLFAYTYFTSIFWIATIGEELFGKKQKW